MTLVLMTLLPTAAVALVVTTWLVWLLRRRGIVTGPRWAAHHGRVVALAVLLAAAAAAGAALMEPRYLRMLLAPVMWTALLMAVAALAVPFVPRRAPEATPTTSH